MVGAVIAGTVAGRVDVTAVLVVVAVQAEQFPVAAVRRVVVVIMVPVVHSQFTQVSARELPAATAADPGIELERLFAVALLALYALRLSGGDDAVQPCMVGARRFACHACLVVSACQVSPM